MRFLILIFCIYSESLVAQMELSWSIFHPVKKSWIELGTKGSVQEALINSGELPDPFVGENETKFGWIEEHEWLYKSMFFLEEKELLNQYMELEFPSLDTYARVYLNDSLILISENAFIPHRVQIKDGVKKGLNELQIIFTPPVVYHKDTKEKVGYQLPAPNDVHETAIAPYVRKPQYQFGWDWALRMNSMGINKPAVIHSYQVNRVINKGVNILHLDNDRATVEFMIELAVKTREEIEWKSESFGSENVMPLEGIIRRKVEIENPIRWWPKGQGDPYLYEEYIKLYSIDNKEIESIYLKYGLKTSELIQEKDEWGTSYYFKINDRRVFCKGADYIPQDIFPAKVTDSATVSMVELMAESNFNMVRVWGGGYYPDDIFFEKCDELGIMVWQDLMFACAMYPGDDAFISNITNEFEYQMPRISGHPSVVLFNGNNEVEVAWGNWGFQIKHGLYGKSARKIEKAYDLIFKKTAPNVLEKHSTIPYVHTSPLSNWGKMELYNHGSQHYWGVWHGKDPIEDFGKKVGRFNAEYGFQSFPEYATLKSFSEENEWDLSSDVMKHHQKSYVGNDMIMKHAKRLYGTPADFKEFVYLSQLTQAKAVSIAVAGHRIDAPRCGGTLYWQLNDCWPAPTWSSIDYFGNWKALQYRIKDDYEDLSVLEKYNDLNDKEYYLVSDSPDTTQLNVTCKVYSLEGELLHTKEFDFHFDGPNCQKLNISELLRENSLIVFQYKNQKGEHLSRTFEYLPSEYIKASDKEFNFTLEKIDSENKTAVIHLEASKYVRNVWISSSVFGVKFEKNFIHVLPGNTYVSIKFDKLPRQADFTLHWQ